jgi:hypothetical protein
MQYTVYTGFLPDVAMNRAFAAEQRRRYEHSPRLLPSDHWHHDKGKWQAKTAPAATADANSSATVDNNAATAATVAAADVASDDVATVAAAVAVVNIAETASVTNIASGHVSVATNIAGAVSDCTGDETFTLSTLGRRLMAVDAWNEQGCEDKE